MTTATITHLDHLAGRAGIHVPLLYSETAALLDRSPLVTLDRDRHGRILVDEHPICDDRSIVRIRLEDDTPAWISARWLAHRLCDDHCAGIWSDAAREYMHVGGGLYRLATIDDGHYRGDVLILHTLDEVGADVDGRAS